MSYFGHIMRKYGCLEDDIWSMSKSQTSVNDHHAETMSQHLFI